MKSRDAEFHLGGGSQRYCANLGHVTDDESGLNYIGTRFYEPWTGRFVNEDARLDGINWYVYALSSPLVFVDESGTAVKELEHTVRWIVSQLAFVGVPFLGIMLLEAPGSTLQKIAVMVGVIGFIAVAMTGLNMAIGDSTFALWSYAVDVFLASTGLVYAVAAMAAGSDAAKNHGVARLAVVMVMGQTAAILGLLLAMAIEDSLAIEPYWDSRY